MDVPDEGIPDPEGEGLQSLRERTEDVSEVIEESESAVEEGPEEPTNSQTIEAREDA